MKRQTLRLSVKANKQVRLKTSKTKTNASATSTGGGTITLKGTRHGN